MPPALAGLLAGPISEYRTAKWLRLAFVVHSPLSAADLHSLAAPIAEGRPYYVQVGADGTSCACVVRLT